MTTTIEVFDPAMCCSTGVCGPSVDPKLASFEADLRWLAGQGAGITRYNLGSEPGAFAGSDLVRTILQSGGEDALPVVLVDGKLRWTGHYPSRDELASTLQTTTPTGTPTEVTDATCCAPSEQSEAACCAREQTGQGVATAATCSPDATAGGCC